jgi:hypothetical protein
MHLTEFYIEYHTPIDKEKIVIVFNRIICRERHEIQA